MLNWDTANIPNAIDINLCNCDSIFFSYKNLPDTILFYSWEIYQDSTTWITHFGNTSPKITKNSYLNFSLIDSSNQILGPFLYWQNGMYHINFEDCE